MRSPKEEDDRKSTLERLERWAGVTGNPLFIWEALSRCLHADEPDEPIPDFCREYLKRVARKMTLLSWGRDFRNGEPKADGAPARKRRIKPSQARRLVAQALELGNEREKSAFHRIPDEADCQRAADDEIFHGFESALDRAMATHNIERDRAARMIARGRKLMNVEKGRGRPKKK